MSAKRKARLADRAWTAWQRASIRLHVVHGCIEPPKYVAGYIAGYRAARRDASQRSARAAGKKGRGK